MFLHKKSRGIYYLLKEHKLTVLIAYVRPENEVKNCNMTSLFNQKFDLKYKLLDRYTTDKDTPESYMEEIKTILYQN